MNNNKQRNFTSDEILFADLLSCFKSEYLETATY